MASLFQRTEKLMNATQPSNEETRPASRPAFLEEVRGVRSYIDTVGLQQNFAMPPDIYQQLLREHPGGRRVIPSKVGGGQWFSHFLTIHQPTRASLELLQAYAGSLPKAQSWPAFKLVRVDVSLDVLVNTRDAAARATRYLKRHVMPHGRPRKPWTQDSGLTDESPIKSTYLNEPDEGEGDESKDFHKDDVGAVGRGVGTSAYGDLPSKTPSGGPCAHMDWRVRGHDALREFGLRTLQQLLNLDHQLFWLGALKLSAPPTAEKLAAFIERHLAYEATRSKRHVERIAANATKTTPLRLAGALIRAHSDKEGLTNAHDLLLALRTHKGAYGTHPERLFEPVECEWLLPDSPNNALWEDV